MVTQTRPESYTTTAKREQVLKSLRDPEYRREFAADIGTGIAFQIRRLREDRQWTQAELAERTDKRQETISLWENPDYGNYSLSTLKELAGAFDLALMVRFAPFSELINWTVNLTPERLAPPPFDAEFGLSSATTVTSPSDSAAVVDVMEQVTQSLAAVRDAFQTAAQAGEEFESAISKSSPGENQYAKAA